ncbi:MAG: proteasome subunit beta [Candidatus Woesearchaeota archaeon]
MDNSTTKKTGTTTVGIKSTDAVVLAADTRATVGNMIASKEESKVFPLTDNIAITIAGSVASIQMLLKQIRAQIKLRTIKTGREMTVKEVVNLLRNYVFGIIRTPSMIPDIAHLLVGGVDQHGVHLYDIFPDGTLSEIDSYISSGSGSVFAYGVLESKYKADLAKDGALQLAEECIDVAIQRDSASGNGADIYVVDKEGAKQAVKKRVNTHLQ